MCLLDLIKVVMPPHAFRVGEALHPAMTSVTKLILAGVEITQSATKIADGADTVWMALMFRSIEFSVEKERCL